MKLSLITVTFNSLHTLKTTVASALSQKLADLEYIVIDGGSTDGTAAWLKENNEGITKWVSERDNGIYDAMNKGLRLATGEIIGFIHADDVYAHSEVLKEVVQLFRNEDIDLLYGDLEYISDQKLSKVVRYWKSGSFSFSKLLKGWMPPHPTVYFKRNLIDLYGCFDTSYSISADYEWLLRVLKRGLKVAYLPKVMVQMRLGGASNKNLKNLIRKTQEDYRALKTHKMGSIFTLLNKNISKLGQFFNRENY